MYMAPKKKDLDELNSNYMHHIIPSCTNPFELVCYDPEVEDIKKGGISKICPVVGFYP